MKTIQFKADNGYTVTAIENTRFVFDEIWIDKIYERDITVSDGMTVLDIGANQGFFSLYAAGKGARVVSVEPEETNFTVLMENIRINKLEGTIIPVKAAVSGKPGRMVIYVGSYDDPSASFIVSSSRDFLQDRNRLSGTRKQIVRCITLKDLLETNAVGRVDLMKIDCEGAEIDILKNTPASFFGCIENIVMETHNNYSQKELVNIIRNKGFEIFVFDKITRENPTGYLFAAKRKRKNLNIPSVPGPAAVFNIFPYVICGKEYLFDGRESFSPSGSPLSFHWYIDGTEISCKKPDRCRISFSARGNHTVECEVRDGEGRTDRIKQCIYVLDKNYFRKRFSMRLNKPDDRYPVAIKGKKFFVIPAVKEWKPDEIIIAVEYDNNDSGFGISLSFNGDTVVLKSKFNKFVLKDIPPDLEVFFSLESDKMEKAEVFWWADLKPPVIHIPAEDIPEGMVALKQRNEIISLIVDGNQQFFLHRLYLAQIFSGGVTDKNVYLTVLPDNPDTGLEGLFFNSESGSLELKGAYMNIPLQYIEPDKDLLFSIQSEIGPKKIQIEWWW